MTVCMDEITVEKIIVINYKMSTSLKWVKLTATHICILTEYRGMCVSRHRQSCTQKQDAYRDTAPAL